MKMHELYEKIIEDHLKVDSKNIHAYAYWMAEVLSILKDDPAFKKIKPDLRGEIENILRGINSQTD